MFLGYIYGYHRFTRKYGWQKTYITIKHEIC